VGFPNKLLISSSAEKTVKESALLAQKLGCGIEISRMPLYKTEGMAVSETADMINNELEGFTGRRTLHAMFSDVNVSSADYEIRTVSQKRFMQSFEIASKIGADTVLFHTGYKGTKHQGSIYLFKKNFADFFKDFIKEFEKTGITAVIENVFETSPDFCFELWEKTGSESLKFALDTGHVNLYAKNTKAADWIKKYGKNLYHMHIHNNFGENDDHSNLLNGTLDFNEIFECLENEGLSPSIVLEMYSKDDILKSIDYLERVNTLNNYKC